MPNEILPFDRTKGTALSRRMFGSLSLGAAAAISTSALAAGAAVIESDVVIKMADGNCDAALFHPAGTGLWAGAVIFADALGLRPAFREMGRQLAAEGFTVLVPNPYFRVRKAPVLSGPFDFAKPEDRAKLTELRVGLNPQSRMRDTATVIAFLDTVPQVNTKVKIGVSGYCMGGPYTMSAAAAMPDRVGAAGSFHGGGLVTDQPDSPHLLAAKIKAQYYFAVAANDDQREPNDKVKLRNAFAGKPATVVVYDGCQHGWCVSDGMVFNRAGAERAFAELVALYKKALV